MEIITIKKQENQNMQSKKNAKYNCLWYKLIRKKKLKKRKHEGRREAYEKTK